jgi:hypothetical protein
MRRVTSVADLDLVDDDNDGDRVESSSSGVVEE